MPYSIRFRGLRIDPNRINLGKIEAGARLVMEKHMEDIVRDVRKYPPEPADSTYTRTFQLHDGWFSAVRRSARGLEGTIRNNASDRDSGRRYMVYVQGRWQTSQHATTGWLRVDDLSRARAPELRRKLQAVYTGAIK